MVMFGVALDAGVRRKLNEDEEDFSPLDGILFVLEGPFVDPFGRPDWPSTGGGGRKVASITSS